MSLGILDGWPPLKYALEHIVAAEMRDRAADSLRLGLRLLLRRPLDAQAVHFVADHQALAAQINLTVIDEVPVGQDGGEAPIDGL